MAGSPKKPETDKSLAAQSKLYCVYFTACFMQVNRKKYYIIVPAHAPDQADQPYKFQDCSVFISKLICVFFAMAGSCQEPPDVRRA